VRILVGGAVSVGRGGKKRREHGMLGGSIGYRNYIG